ncbi:MAG: bifunctional folylpolyglutamate synthase/dihydrofolate synthase [Treponema sp.]|jgi:dihydrofolate synthase/folylpolyglutamate synthase|nr:bifunctional folylpolyglutamate synthase/dihydrofolate synthase [Treponema sp.]
MEISSSADVFTWLSGFINVETGQFSTSLRLDRMAVLARLAGHPERSAPVIHIAGSKGKGSVTGMIAAILQAQGFRPARYTSPHITEYRERITLGNDFFDESIYIEAGKELIALEEALRNTPTSGITYFDPPGPEDTKANFFELLTLYFFLCARRADCDVMVVETGLGGRLDATNIVTPLVSVITLIELEHTEFLGSTVAAIAKEKAGIIKSGIPLILAPQQDEALEVFRSVGASKNAPLFYLPEIADIRYVQVTKTGTSFSLNSKIKGLFPNPLDVTLPIAGTIQAQNGGLAIIAAKMGFPLLTEKAIQKGLSHFTLPARFERVLEKPVLIVDGAHTPHSIETCTETFTSLYGKGGVLIFGCALGKDAVSMAKILIPQFSHIIITTPGTFKISFPQTVYETFLQEALQLSGNAAIQCIPETPTAIDQALRLGREKGLPLLGTGSFYLAAEIRGRCFNANT